LVAGSKVDRKLSAGIKFCLRERIKRRSCDIIRREVLGKINFLLVTIDDLSIGSTENDVLDVLLWVVSREDVFTFNLFTTLCRVGETNELLANGVHK
jgi:hypothetical protein